MRCKAGDLAVYVGRDFRDWGRVVLIVAPDPEWPGAWFLRPKLSPQPGTDGASCMDHALRPIRDADGEDETLSWASVPRIERKASSHAAESDERKVSP